MRLFLASARRAAVTGLAVGLALTALVACPPPQSPKGPPPLYEDPPAPSWLDGGASAEGGATRGAAEGGASADGGAP